MNNRQKIVSILFLAVLLLFFCGSFVIAERSLEIEYPEIGGEAPTGETKLPEYIKYIFNFSLLLGAILAFAVLSFGGIRWLVSTGSPAAIKEAKSWMLAGIIGLALLLCSYLILTTINPELTIFKEMEPLEPVDGVYLCETEDDCSIKDDPDKRRHYAASAPKIKDFEPRWIKFIDDTNELSSVFVYNDEGYEGDIKEIPNTGADTISSIPLAKSIEFLWNRPGIYLYEKTGFGIDERPPLYLSCSTANLGDWNNKTQSLKIKHPSEDLIGKAVLFTYQEFKGRCGLASCSEPADFLIENLNERAKCYGIESEFVYYPRIGNETLSSIHYFHTDYSKEASGSVVFYDSIDCKGDKWEVPLTPSGVLRMSLDSPAYVSWDGRIISFEINGPYVVILTNSYLKETYPLNDDVRCQLFKIEKPDITRCIPTIRGSYIYDPEPDGDKVRSVTIVPAE